VRTSQRRATDAARTPPALISAAIIASLTGTAAAQSQFRIQDDLPQEQGWTNSVALGDVDGDGDLDVVYANSYTYGGTQGALSLMLLNDGDGQFTPAGTNQFDAVDLYDVALADVDADGDLDVVGGGLNGPVLLLNDGSGTFTDASGTQLPGNLSASFDVTIGDVDGDGDPDILCTNSQAQHLLVNDGSGSFSDATQQLPASTGVRDAAFADVDGDGDADLLLGVAPPSLLQPAQNRLLLNDGAGTFQDVTATHLPVDNDRTNAIGCADLDGDGDLDLVVGNVGSTYFGRQNRLYLNDGAGHFTDATLNQFPADHQNTLGLAIGDVDGDGDLDVYFGNNGFCISNGYYSTTCFGQQNRLYLNNGTGFFTDDTPNRLPSAFGRTAAVVIGDVDGDGDADLISGNNGDSGYFAQYADANKLFLNLQRHIEQTTPFQVFQDWTLEAYLRYGDAAAGDLVVPYLSFARASIPINLWGELRIDPVQALPLPVIAVPQPLGTASLQLTVPAVAGLIGTDLHVQALMVHFAGTPRFSNVVDTVFEGLPPAQITSLAPAAATAGTPVLVTGSDFANGITVTVDGTPATISNQTATSLTFVMPSGIGCDAVLALTNIASSSATTIVNATPTVSAIADPTGPATGGGSVAITGTNLEGATVTINGQPLGNVTTATATSIVGAAPPGAIGAAVVTVVGPTGCQTTASYTYDGYPIVQSFLPASAQAGTPVALLGDNFLPGATLTVAGIQAVVSNVAPDRIDFVMPAGISCDAPVVVTNVGGYSAPAPYDLNATPTIASHSTSGRSFGGSTVFVTGTNLQNATVTIGGQPLLNVTAQTPTLITGTLPAGAVGPVPFVVANGTCQASSSFTYQ